jgi:hypothetical protein
MNRLIAAIGAAMIAAYLGAMTITPRADGRVVVGDATHHFVQLRSIVFDGDLHFQNDYVGIYGLKGGERGTDWVFDELTPTGHVRNYMPVGPAILWAPLYLVVAGAKLLLAWIGAGPAPNGLERSLQMTAGVSGILAATASAWIAWRTAARYVRPDAAAWATLSVWVGSHALYYSLVSPAYSHAASMLASSAFVSYWLATRDAPSIRHAALWGALVGACALMRWQDALFMIVPLIDIARWRAAPTTRILAATVCGLTAAVAFTPQMIVWQTLYGQPLALPQGPSFIQWTSPHLWSVLASDNHGLFTWAPLLVLAVPGVVRFLGARRDLAWPIAIVCLTSWYLNAAVADWWAGEAFGARRFLSLFPIFVIGLAAWLDAAPGHLSAAPGRRRALVTLLVGANLLLLLQYQLAMKGLEAIAPYPRGWFDMWIARFLVPARLVAWWTT